MKKIIIALFLLMFTAASFLLYLKITEKPSLEQSIDSGRKSFSRNAQLDFQVKDTLWSEGEREGQVFSFKIKGSGRDKTYNLKGLAFSEKKKPFVLIKKKKERAKSRPKAFALLLPLWIKNWTSNSRYLLAQLIFSQKSLNLKASEKEKAYTYLVQDNFLKNIVKKSAPFSFASGKISFSKENSLPVFIQAIYKSKGQRQIGLNGMRREIKIKINWEER